MPVVLWRVPVLLIGIPDDQILSQARRDIVSPMTMTATVHKAAAERVDIGLTELPMVCCAARATDCQCGTREIAACTISATCITMRTARCQASSRAETDKQRDESR